MSWVLPNSHSRLFFFPPPKKRDGCLGCVGRLQHFQVCFQSNAQGFNPMTAIIVGGNHWAAKSPQAALEVFSLLLFLNLIEQSVLLRLWLMQNAKHISLSHQWDQGHSMIGFAREGEMLNSLMHVNLLMTFHCIFLFPLRVALGCLSSWCLFSSWSLFQLSARWWSPVHLTVWATGR